MGPSPLHLGGPDRQHQRLRHCPNCVPPTATLVCSVVVKPGQPAPPQPGTTLPGPNIPEGSPVPTGPGPGGGREGGAGGCGSGDDDEGAGIDGGAGSGSGGGEPTAVAGPSTPRRARSTMSSLPSRTGSTTTLTCCTSRRLLLLATPSTMARPPLVRRHWVANPRRVVERDPKGCLIQTHPRSRAGARCSLGVESLRGVS